MIARLDDPAVKVVVERPCRLCGTDERRGRPCPVCDGCGVEYFAVFQPMPDILNSNTSFLDVPA